MFGTVIIDVAIGLILVYLILGLMCSSLQEILASMLKLRANNLEDGIKTLLKGVKGRDLTAEFYAHPLIKKLSQEGSKPSYIPARIFAVTLLDILKGPENPGNSFAQAEAALANLPDGDFKSALRTLLDEAEGDVKKIRRNLETWFDDTMDRVAGWYKRRVQVIMLGIAFGLTVVLNVDSIRVAETLWQEPAVREIAVSVAQELAAKQESQPTPASTEPAAKQDESQQNPVSTVTDLQKQLGRIGVPIGWAEPPWAQGFMGFLRTLFGWILTALAVSLGAPFWFNALGKLLNMRSSGGQPEKSKST